MRIIKTILYVITIVLLCVMAFSCTATKYVDREKIVSDSLVLIQKEGLQRTLKEMIEKYEKEREQWESTGVVFNDTPCPDSATKTVTKIVFDNGKIKSIEGNVKALNQSLYEKSAELLDAYTTIDSMGIELEKKEVQLSKKETVLIKEKKIKPAFPLWLIIVGIVAGWIGRGYWPGIRLRLFG